MNHMTFGIREMLQMSSRDVGYRAIFRFKKKQTQDFIGEFYVIVW